MSCLGPQSAIRCVDAHPIGYKLFGCVANTGESRDACDATSSWFPLNDRLHHNVSFNFRPPEMLNPFRW